MQLLRKLGKRWIWILIGALAISALVYWRKNSTRDDSARDKAAVTPVAARTATKSDLGVYLSGLGTVTPLRTVTIRARVDGQLMGLYFAEGQAVGEGALLAEVDPRPFQAQLAQAEGQKAKDEALFANAKVDL